MPSPSSATSKPRTHGFCVGGILEPLYVMWAGMKARCHNKNHASYYRYGGRGITVCEEWLDYPTFRTWALEHGYKPGLTIDRERVNEGYHPGNCRWMTLSENIALAQADRKVRGDRKLNPEVVAEIKTELIAGASKRSLAAKHGVNVRGIFKIWYGEIWPEVEPFIDHGRQPLKKISDEQVIEIRRKIQAGATNPELAAEYGVDRTTISKIRHNKGRPCAK